MGLVQPTNNQEPANNQETTNKQKQRPGPTHDGLSKHMINQQRWVVLALSTELRFVATVTTGGRVKFVPAV